MGTVSCRALIDTGASSTAIARHVLEALDLKPVGVGKVRTVGQTFDVSEFAVRLRFPAGKQIELVAFGSELPDELGCLIGRDVLSEAVFTYDGPVGEFELRF